MAGFSLNADSQTVRKQLITVPLEVGMVETVVRRSAPIKFGP